MTHDPDSAVTRPLTSPVLVRGEDWRTVLWVLAGGFLLVGFGIGLLLTFGNSAGGGRLAYFFGCVIAPYGLVLLGKGFARAAKTLRPCWLEITATGFLLTRHGGKQSVSDEQVVGLRLSWAAENETPARKVVVEIAEGKSTRQIHFSYRPGQVDPLAGLWERLARGLAARLREQIPQGGVLVGRGWRLDAAGLHWGPGEAGVSTTGQISHAHVIGHHLWLWKESEENPFLLISLNSHNAPVLAALLLSQVQDVGRTRKTARPAQAETRPASNETLGRLLFERRSGDLQAGLVWLLLAGFLCLLSLPVTDWMQLGGLSLAALCAIPAGLVILFRRRDALRVHQFGISQPDTGARLLYGQIESLVCQSEGPPMFFHPAPGQGLSTIRFAPRAGGKNEDLTRLCHHVGRLIADRLFDRLQAGQSVEWGESLRFLPTGLQFRSASSPDGKTQGEPVVVPYRAVSFRWVRSSLLSWQLLISGPPFADVRLSTNGPNFWPCWFLLNGLQNGDFDLSGGNPLADRAAKQDRRIRQASREEFRLDRGERQEGQER